MDGTVSFIEFGADDPSLAGPFLAKVFGWSFTPHGSGGMLQTPAGRAGMHGGDGEHLYVYYRVTDLKAAMTHVEELGGAAKQQGPGTGEFGWFADCTGPGGLMFGLHQPPTG